MLDVCLFTVLTDSLTAAVCVPRVCPLPSLLLRQHQLMAQYWNKISIAFFSVSTYLLLLCHFLSFFLPSFLPFSLYSCVGSSLLCARAFSSCGERGLLFVAVHGLLIVVASCCKARALGTRVSVVVAHGLSSLAHGF